MGPRGWAAVGLHQAPGPNSVAKRVSTLGFRKGLGSTDCEAGGSSLTTPGVGSMEQWRIGSGLDNRPLGHQGHTGQRQSSDAHRVGPHLKAAGNGGVSKPGTAGVRNCSSAAYVSGREAIVPQA